MSGSGWQYRDGKMAGGAAKVVRLGFLLFEGADRGGMEVPQRTQAIPPAPLLEWEVVSLRGVRQPP